MSAFLLLPLFAILIITELLWSRRQRRRVYNLRDSIANLAIGGLSELVVMAGALWIVGAYVAIWETCRLVTLSTDSWWVWGAAIVGFDFAYYWFHRLAHRVTFLWAAHAPHHQSRRFNVTVALRQGAFQPLFSCVFYWPLAVAGVPPLAFAVGGAVVTLWGLWIHTELIGRVPLLEGWVQTPSSHRVHHACDARYLGKNFGAMLAIWDRWFGTYAAEDDGPLTFGCAFDFEETNPIAANLGPWRALLEAKERQLASHDR